MTNFQGWEKLCKELNTDIWIMYKALDRPECGLFETKGSYWVGNTKFYDTPVYQVWIDDTREIAVMNMQEAIAYWKRRAKEEGIEYTGKKEEILRKKIQA